MMKNILALLKRRNYIKGALLVLWMDKLIRFYSVIISIMFFFSFFLYILFPESRRLAETKNLLVSNQPPGFEVRMLRIVENKREVEGNFFSRLVYGPSFSETYIPITGWNYDGSDIVVKEFSASGDSLYESRYNLADVVYPLNPGKKVVNGTGAIYFEKIDGTTAEEPISNLKNIIEGQYVLQKRYILGTDFMGRDVLYLFLVASRGTLMSAFIVAFLAFCWGASLGTAVGLLRGKIKLIVMWVVKSINSIPALLLIIALMFIIGSGFWHVCLLSGFVFGIQTASIIVARISSGRKRKDVEVAYSLGITRQRVMKRYVIPDLIKPVFSFCVTVFFSAILVESSLNFLKIGFGDDVLSWGWMIRENYGYIFLDGQAYLTLLPGIAIAAVAFLFAVIAGRTHKILKEDFRHTLV